MEEKEIEQIKEYLRLKKIEETDVIDDIIDKEYNEVIQKIESNIEKKD